MCNPKSEEMAGTACKDNLALQLHVMIIWQLQLQLTTKSLSSSSVNDTTYTMLPHISFIC